MILILDIETQELIPQDHDLTNLRISFAGVKYGESVQIFAEQELDKLFVLMDNAELIVGHNLLLFDYKILQRYASFDIMRYKEKTFDLFHLILRKTDRRVSLNDLAQRNLGIEKLGDGKDAPKLFINGQLAELKQYLMQDLEITYRLFLHIQEYGMLKYGLYVYKEPVERQVLINVHERS
jgi:hypothetical protein